MYAVSENVSNLLYKFIARQDKQDLIARRRQISARHVHIEFDMINRQFFYNFIYFETINRLKRVLQ